MIRHLLLVLLLVLTDAAIASRHELQLRGGSTPRKLNARQCPVPYIWKRPSWWKKYRVLLTSKRLKMCKFLQGKVPNTGTTCLPKREGFVCMFGEARCNNVVEPETRCDCTNGVWDCKTVCPNLKCPVTKPSGICDPLVNILVCEYDEDCCGDTCAMTSFCRCETTSGSMKWNCASADVKPCTQTSLEEAGCDCNRPVNGGQCTADFACGSACCGKDAYTCKCNNNTGMYESCGKTGYIPGPLETCSCAAVPTEAPVRNGATSAPTASLTKSPVVASTTEAPIPLAPASPSPAPTSFTAPDDLSVRFNKFVWPNNVLPANAVLPLLPRDYPISPQTASWLRTSNAISVVQEDDCWECKNAKMSFADLIASVGGEPSHPSRNASSPYWADLRQVIRAQSARLNGASASDMMTLPTTWTGWSLATIAESVHDEVPGSLHIAMIAKMIAENAIMDTCIIPTRSTNEFLRKKVMLADTSTWAIGTVGPMNFGTKWSVGRARPEEVIWKIFAGKLNATHGVPQDVIDSITSTFPNMTKSTDATAYPEGSPTHPSWPAMHSAASSASMWMAVVMDLTEQQLCEVKKMDWGVSYARTIAGVHYPTDNIAGLNMGQEVLSRTLPAYLQTMYGSDPAIVAAKIATLRFNWANFPTSACATNAVTPSPPKVSACGLVPTTVPSVIQASTFVPPADDLLVRFNKFVWPNNVVPSSVTLPLKPGDYPISPLTASALRTSNAISVTQEDDCAECKSFKNSFNLSLADLIAKIGGFPTHPSRNSSSPYWNDLRTVILAQEARLNATNPASVMPLTKAWKNYTLADIAKAVHDEVPGSLHVKLIDQLMREGASMDKSIVPTKSANEFLRKNVMLADLNTWALGNVGPINFGFKWSAGRARPEEVIWKIATKELNSAHGVPQDVISAVARIFPNLTKSTEATAYPEGSPTHPSWPAMHSAISSASMWMAVVMDLTEEQFCQAKLMDWGVSYARTVAGVHYPTDNVAGLKMGQEVLSHTLPGHLQERYGCDPVAVAAKIATLRFDWADFAKTDCAKLY